MAMPLNYRIRKYLQSNFGKLRTGDRVVVVKSWAELYINEGLDVYGDRAYTGTVISSVYDSITIKMDHGFWRNADIEHGPHVINELRDNVHRI